MTDKPIETILVAYASLSGSTAGIAQEIGRVLTDENTRVHVLPVEQVENLRQYDAVVLGSAIRVGQWLPAARKFLQDHLTELNEKPVAFFTVCLTLKDDTSENRATVETYTAPLRHILYPVAEGFFAGALDRSKLSWPTRLLVTAAQIPEGDFRAWDQIEEWTRAVRPWLHRREMSA